VPGFPAAGRAGAGGQLQLTATQQLDDQRPGGDQRPAALGDQREDRVEVRLPAERPGDLDRGIECVNRLLKRRALGL
jgi:hypothetical protein